jgi:PhnB protein
MAVRSIPEGYASVTPFLIISGAAEAIDFYIRVFDAEELMRFDGPNDTVAHAELQVGNSRIMVSDEHPQMGFRSPESVGGSGAGLMLYVDDVDRVFTRAIDAGAKTMQEVKDQFYGDRSGTLIDPFGHIWTIATHIEDVTEEEMQRRMEAARHQPVAR